MTPLDLAIEYFGRFKEVKSFDELALICCEVKIDKMDAEGFNEWADWLLTCYESAHLTLSTKESKPEDVLNAEGLKRFNEGML
jgi:hypothetical protein